MVNQSINMGLLSCGLGDDVVPERVGEDENHRDHEAVDGRGLNHRQAHEQGPGDSSGGIRLLGKRTERRRDRFPFRQRRPHSAETGSDAGDNY